MQEAWRYARGCELTSAQTRIDRDLYLHPRHFGREIKQQIVQKLHEEVEGTCHGRYGFIIAVTEIDTENMGMGMVQEGTGFVVYPVTFSAVVMKPFPNEIIDAVVTSTTVNGLLCSAGPLDIFCSHWVRPRACPLARPLSRRPLSRPLDLSLDLSLSLCLDCSVPQMPPVSTPHHACVSWVSPLVYLPLPVPSRSLADNVENIPEEYEFNRQNNTYTSSDGLVIANDSDVRIKVLTVRYQAHKIVRLSYLLSPLSPGWRNLTTKRRAWRR